MTVIGLLSPGDMGSAVGQVLGDHGVEVLTDLRGRSERTCALARAAKIDAVASLEELVSRADAVVSIVVPSRAAEVAAAVSSAMESTGSAPLFVDANAVSPETAISLAVPIEAAGASFVDGCIIGPPPRPPGRTRIYVSGTHARSFVSLADGLDVRVAGSVVGQASALKMSYAALTKGTIMLATALLTGARRLGVYDALIDEFELSQGAQLRDLERAIPFAAPKAHRWEGEMEEIARTLASVDLPDGFHRAAAQMCALVADSPAGRETPESRTDRSLESIIEEFAQEVR